MGRVDGKVALVTGAASGLGAADARRLAGEGATVFLSDLAAEQGAILASSLPGATFVRHDVTSEGQWVELFDLIKSRHGRLDILVNNAGIVKFGTIETATLKEFRSVNRVAVEGTFLGCKYGIPLMRGGGSIINMASIAVLKGFPTVSYTASKGAVRAMTKSIAIYCQDKGYDIRCNVVLPGTIETPMSLSAIHNSLGGEDRLASTVADMRWGKAGDVANLVLYLASDEARYVTGAEFCVDGGDSIR